MKCKDCDACRKGYFKSKPDDYVCIGVCEPFVIENIDKECTEYTSFTNLENIMELSQEEKDKLYKLIDKLNPCVEIASKETIKRFKEWTEGQIKTFEIPDNDKFLCEDKIYLIPVEPPNKPIKVFIEGE